MLIAVAGDLQLRDMVFLREGKCPLAGYLFNDSLLLEGFLNFIDHEYMMERKREKGFTMLSGQIIGYIR
jgi:hypothetical protein